MIRGLYTSGWSMLASNKKMDVISNNLANVNTNAFKKDTVVFESFPSLLTKRIYDTRSNLNPTGEVGTMELSNDVGEVFTYFSQGNLENTENQYDLAFQESNKSFFTVGVPNKDGNLKEYYTRDGSFTRDANNQLVTKDGNLVMGENGPITLYSDKFSVEADGLIIEDDTIVDRILIKEFTDTKTLRKYGLNLLETTDETQEQPFSGKVKQGFLEQSNVNIVSEMVDMITVMRAYEANQKVLQAQDGTLEKVVNEVGAVR